MLGGMPFLKMVTANVAKSPFLLASSLTFAMNISLGLGAAAAGLSGGLADIKVGENGTLTRIAISCETECFVVQRGDGAFFITDVQEDVTIDLKDRANNADSISLMPAKGGSVLTVAGRGAVVLASVIDCVSDQQRGACIDLTFEEIAPRPKVPLVAQAVAQNNQVLATNEKKDGSTGTNAIESHAQGKHDDSVDEDLPYIGVAIAPEITDPTSETYIKAPPLREKTGEELLRFEELAPPERFSPPEVRAIDDNKVASERAEEASSQVAIANVAAVREQIIAFSPSPRDRAEVIVASSFDLYEEVDRILDRRMDTGACAGARARLQADPWALDAMVERGLCLGVEGKSQEADAIFQRLLAYTPDNYEALVGRGLVAAHQGETELALKYLQDALNALPPIQESNKIVAVMDRLTTAGL